MPCCIGFPESRVINQSFLGNVFTVLFQLLPRLGLIMLADMLKVNFISPYAGFAFLNPSHINVIIE